MASHIEILDAAQVRQRLPALNVMSALKCMFGELAAGRAVQPAQALTLFPGDSGDVIAYSGVLAAQRAFGVKLSPYIVGEGGALVTAWTLLMSTETGQPLLLCDSKQLTTERTAATTALAVDLLAPRTATRLVIIGAGPVAQAHLRHALTLRDWSHIAVVARKAEALAPAVRASFCDLDPRVSLTSDLDAALAEAEAVLLCTSSAGPVIDPAKLTRPALITSISTNAVRAHEIPPEQLAQMDVYCDYRATTPGSAGEMRIAAEAHGWSPDLIRGDLPELVTGTAPAPDYQRHAFFRSIGLGLEDIAIAAELHRALQDSLS
jgi:L-arginine dehydrogenase